MSRDLEVPTSFVEPCRGCGETLPRTTAYYHREPRNASGLKLTCRSCRNEAERIRYRATADEAPARKREARVERTAYFVELGVYEAA